VKEVTKVLLPSDKVNWPKSFETLGALSWVVEALAAEASSVKSTPPVPENS
jgi:hypothetical protein